MNREELIKEAVDFAVSRKGTSHADDRADFAILVAEREAIKFAEWASTFAERNIYDNTWERRQGVYTTAELYQIFKEETE